MWYSKEVIGLIFLGYVVVLYYFDTVGHSRYVCKRDGYGFDF